MKVVSDLVCHTLSVHSSRPLLAIQAPLVPPPLHLKDRRLLRPLKSLGQPKNEVADVSFLRRTQYTAEDNIRARGEKAGGLIGSRRKKPNDTSKDEPINVLRSVIKGFDIANPEDAYKGPDTEQNIRGHAPTLAETEAWKNPQHPTNPKLKVLDSYPILPDHDAITDSVGYMVTKFAGNPSNATDSRDERMDVSLLHPIELSAEQQLDYQAKHAAHEADPVHYPAPGLPAFDYEFFLPSAEESTKNIKKKFNVDDPERDDPELYKGTGKNSSQGSFRYNNVRIYETGLQSNNSNHQYQEVAIALHDPELEKGKASTEPVEDIDAAKLDRHRKAAYYYPIVSKVQLKPRRSKHLAHLGTQAAAGNNTTDEANKIDAVDLVIRDLDEIELSKRASHKAELNGHDDEGPQDSEGATK